MHPGTPGTLLVRPGASWGFLGWRAGTPQKPAGNVRSGKRNFFFSEVALSLRHDLQLDDEAMYSVTNQHDADRMTHATNLGAPRRAVRGYPAVVTDRQNRLRRG